MEIIYIYDTYCGWCNIAKYNIKKLYDNTKNTHKWTFLHLNLFNNNNIIEITPQFLSMVKNVGTNIALEKTGKNFSAEYFNLLQKPNFIHQSDVSALCCATIEYINKDILCEYSLALQNYLFDKGCDITLDLATSLAHNFNILEDDFKNAYKNNEVLNIKNANIIKAKKYMVKLKSNGIPLLVLNNNNTLTKLDAYSIKNL